MFKGLVAGIKRAIRRNETKRINKDKFISIVAKQIEKENKERGGVNIPEFLEAEQVYKDFKRNGCFDENGYLKPLPKRA